MVRNSWRLGLAEIREEFLIKNLRRRPGWKVHFLHQCNLESRHNQSTWQRILQILAILTIHLLHGSCLTLFLKDFNL
jgi:hypothetical protein